MNVLSMASQSDGFNAHTLVVGCTVGVVSAATQSLGLTLQRKSHLDNDSSPAHLQKPSHRRGVWRMGVVLFLLANVVGSSVQITTLPLIVLSPLQAVGLVFNSLCAAWVLHEPLTRQSVAGTLLVAVGALVVAAWGVVSESSKPHNLDELLRLLHRPQFLLWMAVTLAIVAAVLVAVSSSIKARLYKLRAFLSSRNKQYTTVTNNDLSSSSLNTAHSRSSSNTLHNPNISKFISRSSTEATNSDSSPTHSSHQLTSKQLLIHGLLYAVVCGILSAHSLLMAKSAVEILVRCFVDGKTSDLYHYQSYLIVFAFLFFAISQLFFMNRGLRLCSTAVLYPLVFCVYNVTSILNSLIYFQQTQNMSLAQAIMVALGTLCILLGVLGLSWHLGWHDDLALEQRKNSATTNTVCDASNAISFDEEQNYSARCHSVSMQGSGNYNTFNIINKDRNIGEDDEDDTNCSTAVLSEYNSNSAEATAVATTAAASYPFGALEEVWEHGSFDVLCTCCKDDKNKTHQQKKACKMVKNKGHASAKDTNDDTVPLLDNRS